jgi:hypothetical protein
MKAKTFLLVTIILVALSVLIGDYIILTEAYGSGPPYYGRTENMDKWVNPFPGLIYVNFAGIGFVAFFVWVFKKIDSKR